MSQSTSLQYEAPWPVYAMDWCKTWAPGQIRARAAFRIALGSYTEDYRNRLAIIGLQDERSLVDDEIHEGYSDFVVLAETMHGYPATKLQWQPLSAATFNWAMKPAMTELLATTGDALRIWDFSYDGDQKTSNFVGRHPNSSGYHLVQRVALSGSKVPSTSSGPPLTSFSWNTVLASHIVTSSIDTTCTVWDINTSTAITQLIAHDREVYDVAWLPGSTDVFTSVGADGSLRLFDLRSLEHSTILYEASTVRAKESSKTASPQTRPMSTPLLRIAFNPSDSHYIATFHADSGDVQILDMRSPGAPVIEIKGHRAQVNAIGWSKQEGMLATAGDDSQVLIWDLSPQTIASPRHTVTSRVPASPRPDAKRRVFTDPVLAYTAPGEINNLAWSPPLSSLGSGPAIPSGEWLAMAIGKTVKVLRV
ncbi:WD40 repeat-like protein [Hysterangium stoloniferum]|nr:WD40 repeat-like protein [Hysterangium stoloniferum]